jgi:putative ABC transport system permease protein
VAPILNASGQVVYGNENTRPRIIGTTPEFEAVRNSPVSSGEFFQASHIASRSNVALLGESVLEKLFGEEDPLGKWIRINNVPFRVIGVLQKKGATGFVDQDDVILVPITTVQSRLIDVNLALSPNPVTGINIQVVSADQMDDAVEQISDVLRKRHRIRYEDDFDIVGQDEVLRTANQVISIFTFFLGSVAAISLVVGGIGIMNIMLVSVTERTREIGIRKAVGATHLDILIQFLSEAIILTNAGGLIGILLGLVLTMVISNVEIGGMTISPIIEINTITLAMGFSTVIGVIFGLYPASHAAQLNPIEALRYE